MNHKLLSLLLLSLLALNLAGAAQVAGPLLGVVADPPSAGIRLIRGIPGAATLSDPIPLGIDAGRAALSATGDYLLAPAADRSRILLVRNLSSAPSQIALPDVAPSATRIVLSPDGSSAALLYAARNCIQVIQGLPGAPSPGAELLLTGLPGRPSSIAISDDGQSVVVVARDSLVAFGPDGVSRTIASAKAAVVAFLHRSSDIVFTDTASNSVFSIRDVNGAAELRFIARGEDAVASPAALAIPADNQTLLVANSASGAIARIRLAGGEPELASCECSVSGLRGLNGSSAFLLNQPGTGPLWFFDGDAPGSRIRFVPAPVTAPAEGGLQ